MIARNYFIFLFIFLFALLPCMSQEQNEWMEQGDLAFKNEDYTHAISFYLKVITNEVTTDIARPYEFTPYIRIKKGEESDDKKTSGKPKQPAPKLNQPAQVQQYIIHQLAESYRLNHDYANAEQWYKKSISSKPPLQYPYDHYWYADALIKNNNCKAALAELEAVFKLGERKNPALFQQAKIKQLGCRMMADSSNYKKELRVYKVDSALNRGSTTFAANYFGDAHTVQFTNANTSSAVEAGKPAAQMQCDLYLITKTEKGWEHLIKMESSINTIEHEVSGCLSPDKNTFYFTRWSPITRECAIYISRFKNQQWLAAEKLPESVNLSGSKSMHPSLSKDGSTLYFSSDRPGGIGKMDLWSVKLNDKQLPEGAPVNMGAKFNTTEDEITPFFHAPTNTLFFSSNGLPGFGGLDVYKSSYDPDSLWSSPKNVGAPINSSKDDAYFVLDRNQLQGFLSSDREECKDCSGGGCYKLYAVEKKPAVFQLKGSVYNAETNHSIPGVLLTFSDVQGYDPPFFAVSDSTGSFSVPVKEGRELKVKAQKNGFFGDASSISTVDLNTSKEFSQDFFLSTIPKGEIVIPQIEYETNKADLKSGTLSVLDELVKFLNLNDNLKVEIGSHTDERGNNETNLKLSQDRAQGVVNYLIAEGIPADRLISAGYGGTQPLIPHAETEQEHQKNSRTTLRLISEKEIKTNP